MNGNGQGLLTETTPAEHRSMPRGTLRDMVSAKVVLAPMAGVTDIAFRMMCRKFGCAFAFTEMVDVNGIYFNNIKTMKYLDTLPGDMPLGAQIAGQDENRMLCGAIACCKKGFQLIDINAGCPARKVVKGGKGSALLKDPPKLGRIVGLLSRNTNADITVKIRSGWDENSINYLDVARVVESEGAKAICVHPRTASEMYRGSRISYEAVKAVKRAVDIPVFASGNIFSPEDAEAVIKSTGCDGVFVARGSMGNPWIFRDIQARLNDHISTVAPGFEDLKDIMAEHFGISERCYGSFLTVKRMYKHVTWYFKKYKNLNAVMESYRRVEDGTSFRRFLGSISLEGREMLVS